MRPTSVGGAGQWHAFRPLLIEEAAVVVAERAGHPARPCWVWREQALEQHLAEFGTVGSPELYAAAEARGGEHGPRIGETRSTP